MWWQINVNLAQPEQQSWRTIERWEKADSGPEALIQFLGTIDFKEGEMIHFIHISRPSERAPL